MRITAAFVVEWAGRYVSNMGSVEPELFETLGPGVAARGFYEPEELAKVARWKTPRSQRKIQQNEPDDVRDVTSMAFSAPERLQHRVLTMLDGVRVATATALLTVAFPDRHTVIDFRSTEALHLLGEWDGAGGYVAYLRVCRRLANELEVDLRTLDRALWRWSKDGYAT